MLIPSPLLCLEGEVSLRRFCFLRKSSSATLTLLFWLCSAKLCCLVLLFYLLQQLTTGKGPHRRSRQFFLCIFLCIGCAKSICSGKVPTAEAGDFFFAILWHSIYCLCVLDRVCLSMVLCSLMTFFSMCLYLFCVCLCVCLPICVWCCGRVQLDDLL